MPAHMAGKLWMTGDAHSLACLVVKTGEARTLARMAARTGEAHTLARRPRIGEAHSLARMEMEVRRRTQEPSCGSAAGFGAKLQLGSYGLRGSHTQPWETGREFPCGWPVGRSRCLPRPVKEPREVALGDVSREEVGGYARGRRAALAVRF